MRECYNEVEAEDEGRLSTEQDIFRKCTDTLKRIIAPGGGVGGVTVSYVWLIVIASHLSTTFLGMERSSEAGGVRLVAASMIGGLRTGSWSYKTVQTTEKPQLSGSCGTTGNQGQLDQRAEVLTDDGDSPVGIIVPGLLERSRTGSWTGSGSSLQKTITKQCKLEICTWKEGQRKR